LKKLLLLISLAAVLFAQNSLQNDYSMRVAYGKSTASDLGSDVYGNIKSDIANLYVYNLDGGYLLKKNLFDIPMDIYAKGGFSYYDEGSRENAYGADIYLKAFYNFDFLKNSVRLGFGEGVSYTTRTLTTEAGDAAVNNDNTSKFLNYLDISLDFDLGKLLKSKTLNETYIGILIKHRSGIFGLINNVKHGGSNYNSLYIEKNF
jgi:outer membrane protein